MLNGSVVKRWIYQDQLTPAAEVDSAGNVVTRFAPGYITKGACPPLSGVDSTYALITDHLGSVRLVVNVATGAVRQRIDYDEFGNILFNSNEDFQPFSFAGGISDSHTKLIRFGARDYDSKTGRWTSKDPIGFGGGVSNLYEYCINDPINYVDDNGLQVGPFRNRDKAGYEAVNQINPTSISKNREYLFWIYKNSAGYSSTKPQEVGPHGPSDQELADFLKNKPKGTVDWGHTHGANTGNDDEHFSPGDIGFTKKETPDGFGLLGTPNKKTFRYNPRNNTTNELIPNNSNSKSNSNKRKRGC